MNYLNSNHYHIIVIALFPSIILGQNIENVGKSDPIKINGGISGTSILYASDGIASRREPFTYFLSGNLNVNIYDFSVPLTFSYSDHQATFRQPFNQFGLSPKYKWATAHIGYRSMQFSNYTLSNYVFLGGGLELSPSIFRFQAMYGRLQEAVKEDSLSTNNEPAYNRKGWGVKAGIEKNNEYIYAILFKGKDDPNSLDFSDLLPEENFVTGIKGHKKIGKQLSIAFDYAQSSINRNTLVHDNIDGSSYYQMIDRIFNSNSTTYQSFAFKSTLQYTGKRQAINLSYEKVDPEYRSMGTYFFNNDFENVSIGIQRKLLAGKLSSSINTGIQRNNIRDTELNNMKRLIGSVQLTYVPSKEWSVSGVYSNFTVNTRIKSGYEQFNQIDSLNLTQVTQSSNLSITHRIGDKNKNILFTWINMFQSANNDMGNDQQVTQTTFFNSNLSCRSKNKLTTAGYGGALNFKYQKVANINISGFGPVANFSKEVLKKKLKMRLMLNYNKEYSDGVSNGYNWNIRFGNNLKIGAKNSLSLRMSLVHRNSNNVKVPTYTEYTGTINYKMNF